MDIYDQIYFIYLDYVIDSVSTVTDFHHGYSTTQGPSDTE